MKILFVPNDPYMVVLEEMLYHGLLSKFYRNEIIDYPFKPWYHGLGERSPNSYVAFHDPNPIHWSRDEVKAMKDSFDLVIIGSQRVQNNMPEITADVLSWNFTCPIVYVDGEDSPHGPKFHEKMYLDKRIKLYFKSEFYPEFLGRKKMRPLPGAVYGEDGCEVEQKDRPISVICSGQRNASIRNEIYPIIAGIPDSWVNDKPREVPLEEYKEKLCSSKIGISARGHAWICHKYWRIPLYGCLLLSQRMPMIIPDNFEEWESAVFFERADQLPKLIDLLLKSPEMMSYIARQGREVVRNYHMSIHRVNYLLKCVKEVA